MDKMIDKNKLIGNLLQNIIHNINKHKYLKKLNF